MRKFSGAIASPTVFSTAPFFWALLCPSPIREICEHFSSSSSIVPPTFRLRISNIWSIFEKTALHDDISPSTSSLNIQVTAASLLSRLLLFGVAISPTLAIPETALGAETIVTTGNTLVVNDQADLNAPNDTTVVQDGGTLEITGNAVIAQDLYTLYGNGDGDVGAIHSSSGNNVLSGNIELGSSTTINASAGVLTLNGDISSSVPIDLDLAVGGDGDILYTGDINLGGAGQSYSFEKVGSGKLTLTGTNNSYIGYLEVDDGILEISSGGKFTVTGASINDAVFINSNLLVTGPNSAFTIQDYDSSLGSTYLVVGRDTTGPTSVTVNAGAHMTTTAARIGEGTSTSHSSDISATVDGVGSIWDFGTGVAVGSAPGGTASLTISNGGIMKTATGGSVSIGNGGNGTATVTGNVGGNVSQLQAGSLKVGEYFNGGAGNGALTVENGASVSAQSAEVGTGGVGTITVTGAASRLQSSFLAIGQDTTSGGAGQGSLTIENGGYVSADNTFLGLRNYGISGSSGSLEVLGSSVLETTSLMKGFETASALFDGGTLRAAGNTADNAYGNPFIGSYSGTFVVDIGANGMFIDTQAYDVTAAAVLADDDTLAPGFLNKQGSGRLVLTADNTYSAGTTITAGTLQLGAGGTSGWIVGDVTDNGVLAFNRSDIKTFDGTIIGTGSVHQIGTGKTILTADSSALTGISQVQNGILSVNGILGGSMEVRGGRLQGIGRVGDTTNFAGGTIAPGNSIGTLTVAGDYIGSGGRLEIETVLGDDSSATDKLVVTGNTSGNTDVQVINVGGTGAQTREGIKIVDVAGTSGGNFTLLGSYTFEGDPAVVAGAYAYRLYQGGVSTPADGDWYLRSSLLNSGGPGTPLYQPGAPVYEAYAGVLQSFNDLDTLQQRLGNRSWSNDGAAANMPANSAGTESGTWGRILARHASIDPRASITGDSYDSDLWQLQAGADGQFYSGDAGDLIGGLSVRYGTISADVSSIFGNGSINSTGYGLGGSMTWYGATGFYLDARANTTWYDSDLSSSAASTSLISGNDGFGYALGLEAGQQIALGSNWSLTPQAQLTYSAVDYDKFTDVFGAAVSLDEARTLRGRLGISADYENSWTDRTGKTRRLHAYGITNLYYDFQSSSRAMLSGVRLASEQDALWGGIGLGGTYNWSNNRYALYGEATIDTSLSSFGDNYTLTGRMGLNVKF